MCHRIELIKELSLSHRWRRRHNTHVGDFCKALTAIIIFLTMSSLAVVVTYSGIKLLSVCVDQCSQKYKRVALNTAHKAYIRAPQHNDCI